MVATGEEVIGSLQGYEAARMASRAKDLTGVRNADGVVGRGVQHQQRSVESADLLVQVRLTHVIDEVPPQSKRLATDQKRCFPISEDPFDQGVVVVLYMPWVIGRANARYGSHGPDLVGGCDHRGSAKRVPHQKPYLTT